MRERVADDFRLLVDLLRHEMAMVALVHQAAPMRSTSAPARFTACPRVVDLRRRCGCTHRPVAVFQIADRVGERRERDRVGAQIHLAVAVADRERRAAARADQEIVLACEQQRQRKRAAQPRQRGRDRLGRRGRCASVGHQMGDDFGVGLGRERRALRSRISSRSSRKFSMMPLWTIATRSVACGCALTSFGPPWVAQRVWPMPMVPASGSLDEALFEVPQLAFGAPAREVAVFQRGDAGRIVAAVFEPL